MEILNQFGFNIKLFAAQIINFAILFFLFSKFIYPQILKTINDREEKITKGLSDAQDAQVALTNAQARQDEIIKKAGIEAEKIITESRKTAAQVRESTITQTRVEAEKIVQEARDQAKLEIESVRREAESIALLISQKILAKSIENLFTAPEKKTVVDRNLKQLETLSKKT